MQELSRFFKVDDLSLGPPLASVRCSFNVISRREEVWGGTRRYSALDLDQSLLAISGVDP